MTKVPSSVRYSAGIGLALTATSERSAVPVVQRYPGPGCRTRVTMRPVTPSAASSTAFRPHRAASSTSMAEARSAAHMGSDSVTWNSPRNPNSSEIMRCSAIAALVPPMAPNSTLLNLSFTREAETGVPSG